MISSRYNIIFRLFCYIKNILHKSNFYHYFDYGNTILLSRPIATDASIYNYQIYLPSTVYKLSRNKRHCKRVMEYRAS